MGDKKEAFGRRMIHTLKKCAAGAKSATQWDGFPVAEERRFFRLANRCFVYVANLAFRLATPSPTRGNGKRNCLRIVFLEKTARSNAWRTTNANGAAIKAPVRATVALPAIIRSLAVCLVAPLIRTRPEAAGVALQGAIAVVRLQSIIDGVFANPKNNKRLHENESCGDGKATTPDSLCVLKRIMCGILLQAGCHENVCASTI